MRKIYLINQAGTTLYKIGITKKAVATRIKELQVGNANELQYITEYETKYGHKLETAMHTHFRTKRINSEWFELNAEEVGAFRILCEKYEGIFRTLKDNPFFK